MANLVDRLQNPFTKEAVIAGGEEMIAIHKFTAALVLYATGDATANNIKNVFNMDASASAQLDTLLSVLDAIATAVEKSIWLQKLEAAGLYYEDGTIDSTQYKNIMGF